ILHYHCQRRRRPQTQNLQDYRKILGSVVPYIPPTLPIYILSSIVQSGLTHQSVCLRPLPPVAATVSLGDNPWLSDPRCPTPPSPPFAYLGLPGSCGHVSL
ncbi:hypothetical protein BDDG_12139, partial [Blastomyces dermatitidis ATCC 18188]